jgi:hypothetical protein
MKLTSSNCDISYFVKSALFFFFFFRDLHETFLQEISPHKMKKEIQQLFWCQEEDRDLIDMMLQSNRRYTILLEDY